MNSVAPAKSNTVGFLSLAADTRNNIYEMVYHKHKRTAQAITVSSEKGYQEVPAAISRTCRQIRLETLPYFFDLGLISFVIRGHSDFVACREWLRFIPDQAWALVQSIRVKQAHRSTLSTHPCNLNFELALDKVEAPVSYWGERQPGCGLCNSEDGQIDCVPIIDLILKDMCGGGKITQSGVDLVFDMLEPLTTG